jgi:ABC-2 type transport system permease protein
MNEPILRKDLNELRVQILGWGFGVGALIFLTVLIYPSISTSYELMMKQLPGSLKTLLDLDHSLTTLEGYMNTEVFSYVPLVLAIFAIIVGTASIVGEEQSGTLEILIAQPLSRVRLMVTKLIGLLLVNGLITGILSVMLWIAILLIDVDVSVNRVILALLLLWPFLTFMSFLSVFLSMLLSSRIIAGSIIAGLLVLSYVLDSLSNLVSELELIRPIYLTTYYQGNNALVSEVSFIYVLGLMGLLSGTFLLSMWLFFRRDIPTHG